MASAPPVSNAPAAGTERVRRPIPERVRPLRQEIPAEPKRSPHSDHPVAAAYRVYDEYLEDGRKYAAGQSAWLNRHNRPGGSADAPLALDPASLLAKALGAAGSVPASSVGAWIDLFAKIVPVIASELARRPAPAPAAWRPWDRTEALRAARPIDSDEEGNVVSAPHRRSMVGGSDRLHPTSPAPGDGRPSSTIPFADLRARRPLGGPHRN